MAAAGAAEIAKQASAAESAKQASAMNARGRPLRWRIEEVIAGDSRLGTLAFIRGRIQASCPGIPARVGVAVVRGSLPRTVPRVPLFLLKKRLLDLIVDAQQTLLGTRGAFAKVCGLGLGFSQSF